MDEPREHYSRMTQTSPLSPKPICEFIRLGLVDYEAAWQIQSRLAAEIAEGKRRPTLLLLEHPHTYTFGRSGHPENLLWDAEELQRREIHVQWVDRGGDVTYHGPGQLVGYPILLLRPGGLQARAPEEGVGPGKKRLPQADYLGYLRKLEETLITALMRLGIASGQIPGLTGVWVQPDVLSRCVNCKPEMRKAPAKIASIGVKVDVHGVSQHGFALNVNPDMTYWDGIIGCGIKNSAAVSLADLLDPPPSMDEVTAKVITSFGETFEFEMAERDSSSVLRKAGEE